MGGGLSPWEWLFIVDVPFYRIAPSVGWSSSHITAVDLTSRMVSQNSWVRKDGLWRPQRVSSGINLYTARLSKQFVLEMLILLHFLLVFNFFLSPFYYIFLKFFFNGLEPLQLELWTDVQKCNNLILKAEEKKNNLELQYNKCWHWWLLIACTEMWNQGFVNDHQFLPLCLSSLA